VSRAKTLLRGTPALLAGCLGLAALSLLLPSAPSYDPWAWIVWGREIVALDLDTTGGPSWKPLPVLFAAVFAPFGAIDDAIPPALWLVVARAGAVLALVMAFSLARRLSGSAGPAGIAAGLIAAAGLVLMPQALRYTAHGNEVPLAIALMLWAIERHLDGERRAVLVLGFLACLLRPEVFPFLALYAVWAWRDSPAERRVIGGLALALPVLWLVPEWLGSGNPFDGGRQAVSEPSWSLSRGEHPWLAVLERMHDVVGWPAEIGAAIAVAFAASSRLGRLRADRRPVRRERAVLALAAAALLWLALVVAMTEVAFSGNPRYFVPAAVICCVLAGVGAAWLVTAAGGAHRLAGVAVAAALAAALAPHLENGEQRLAREARLAGELVELDRQLVRAIEAAGGAKRVGAAGPPSINRMLMPRLAWETEWGMGRLERTPGRAVVFSAPYGAAGWAARVDPSGGGRRRLARVGPWDVLAPLPWSRDPDQVVVGRLMRPPADMAPLTLRTSEGSWSLPTARPAGTVRAPRAPRPAPR
jgi:hypothetical protein